MKIDTIPTKKITAKGMRYSIFTGTKYCFVNFDPIGDVSWDGEKDMVDIEKKSESVLFSKTELERFRPSDSVHNFLLDLNEGQKAELAQLKKSVKTAKTYWEHSTLSSHSCNPKQMIKDRIEFLEKNEIYFVEINFDMSN
jgi:hypothetical protein